MKILFFNKQIGVGGAERKLLIFAKYLKEFYNYKCSFISWPTNTKRTKDIGAEHYIYNSSNDVLDIINKVNPDIIHTTRSGEPEDVFDTPLKEIRGQIPILESNVFGKHGGQCDFRIPISSEVADRLVRNGARKDRMEVLWNSIDYPKNNIGDLREELNIKKDALIFGRISRSDNSIYNSLEVKAYEKFCANNRGGNYFYISLGAPTGFVNDSRRLYNSLYLPETSNDNRIAKFYKTIDVMLHSNKLGESLGTKIQEAMAYGIPIVTHRASNTFNAHITDLLTNDYKYIASERNDVDGFYNHMNALYVNKFLREKISSDFKNKSYFWMPDVILPRLKKIYDDLIKEK